MIALADLHTARFGVLTATSAAESAEDVSAAVAQARASGVQLLILRVPADHPALAHVAEEHGGLLMDTIVVWVKALESQIERDTFSDVRAAGPDDVESIRAVALDAFTDYPSHFRADPRLDPRACDAIYPDWAYRCATNLSPDRLVFVRELDGDVAGFGVIERKRSVADGVLFGVATRCRGRGVFASLLIASVLRARAFGVARFEYSTQIVNITAQRVLVRQGFTPDRYIHTFHFWLD